jgi:MarR family transcriptional regulator, lower aerobic nicotinate degradation pathway regulator
VTDYTLEDQIGFVLRKVSQRHRLIFSQRMDPAIAPAQFAALVKVREQGPTSQNELGRMTAMDAATIKGVIDRLAIQGFVRTRQHPDDGRRLLVEITAKGSRQLDKMVRAATEISEATLEPLSPDERATLLKLLDRIS